MNRLLTFAFTLSLMILSGIYHNAYCQVLDHKKFAKKYYHNDAQWFLQNIPFFECSDKQLEQVYYYRWKMYKAHIRRVGDNKFVITEFINHVPWDREPYCTINAASMHHICEGRWLKDNRYMDGYINNLYQDGGNNRHYSESIADAAFARYLVNCDSALLFISWIVCSTCLMTGTIILTPRNSSIILLQCLMLRNTQLPPSTPPEERMALMMVKLFVLQLTVICMEMLSLLPGLLQWLINRE